MSLRSTVLYCVAVPVPVTVIVPWLILHGERSVSVLPWWHWVGLVPIVSGTLLFSWCAWAFHRLGEGTPNPADPPKHLVVRGPYAWVRNPMYVACLAVLAGETQFSGSDWLARYLIGSVVVVTVLVVAWEEPGMRRRYGEAYRAYCHATPRWIPGRRPFRRNQ